MLYDDILANLLEKKTADEAVEGVCLKALRQIKEIIEDDSLDDPECFIRIEAIVRVLEAIGSDGGNRHDFG